MEYALLTPLLGLLLGYALGRLHTRSTLKAYIAGQDASHRQNCELISAYAHRQNTCWVKSQLPPTADT